MRLELPSRSLPLAGRWRARVESALLRDTLHPNDLPGLLHHGMVAPVLGYGLRGAIWYQGESNAGRALQYAQTFPLLIQDWRRQWGQGDFPFLFVQLAPFNPSGRIEPEGSKWAELREAQRQTLALPHTGMAVTLDIGDSHDIHPRNKHEVGARLALLALKQVYGRSDVVAEGPVMQGHRVRGAAIEVSFKPSSSALALRGAAADLQGFEVAGADRRFRPAQAVIEGERVRVWHPAVPRPVAVRYAWQDDPGQANLANAAGLPAGPFRSDDWPLRTRGVKYRP
jgi:sialate O-acetylesterase